MRTRNNLLFEPKNKGMGISQPVPGLQKAIDYIKHLRGQLTPETMEAVRWEAAQRPENHVWIQPGASSTVALKRVISAIDTGLIHNLVMLHLDGKRSPANALRTALERFASERFEEQRHSKLYVKRCDATIVKGADGEITNTTRVDKILDPIAETFGITPGGSGVSLIESIAFAKALPTEKDGNQTVLRLLPDGSLVKEVIEPADGRFLERTKNCMGHNPGRWRTVLAERGWLNELSLSLCFSWSGKVAPYRTVEKAKDIMRTDVQEWHTSHNASQGQHWYVSDIATPSPALNTIGFGNLIGVQSVALWEQQFPEIPLVDQGPLTWLAALRPDQNHPGVMVNQATREIAFDALEREHFSEMLVQLESLLAAFDHAAAGSNTLDPTATDRLLRQHGFPDNWQARLGMLRLHEEIRLAAA